MNRVKGCGIRGNCGGDCDVLQQRGFQRKECSGGTCLQSTRELEGRRQGEKRPQDDVVMAKADGEG